MSEQECPPASSALPSYRVHRHHCSWDLRTSNTDINPLSSRTRVSSQSNLDPNLEQRVAEVDARRSSSNGWATELATTKFRHGAPRSPKSGEKTVAQLRQRFEQRATQDQGAVGVAGEPNRDHRRSKSIRSTFVPVVRQVAEREASVEEGLAQGAHVLPPFSFSSTSEQPTEPVSSSAISEQDTQEEILPVLRPTVYTGHYSSRTGLTDAPTQGDGPPVLSGDATISQAELAGSQGTVDGCAARPDGSISIIDFAYAQAPDLSSSSAPGHEVVRFASKSDHAPSVHHESSSDESTRSSTTELIDLGEYDGLPPAVRRCESRLGMHDDKSDSEDEGLLLLPSSVYVPQHERPDDTVEEPDDQKCLTVFHAQPAGSQEVVLDDINKDMKRSSAQRLGNNEDGSKMQSESRGNLMLLPASVYTPPEHVAGDSEGDMEYDSPVASTSEEHSAGDGSFEELPAPAGASSGQTEALLGSCETGENHIEPIIAENVPSEAVLSPDESVEQVKAGPKRTGRNFVSYFVGRTGLAGRNDGRSDEEASEYRQNTLRRRIGRRLGNSVLLLVMWKRW